jgi:hypothetical protein
MDYNVNNYTISDLLAILELDDPDSQQIIDKTNTYIDTFTNEKEPQPEMASFFQDVQTKLLRYIQDLEKGQDIEYSPDEEQTDNWYKYEVLPQQDNPVQKDKITDRVQKVDVYDNQHMPMDRNQLGVSNNYQVPVAQDTLNPNLENITKRFINIDSQYRQASGGSESMSTDFTLDLSDPLTDVVSLRLYSYQIPYTWYVIDYTYGNTCFWVTNAGHIFKISIEPGNYSNTDFCNAINNAFINTALFAEQGYSQAFTYPSTSTATIIRYNSSNGKVSLYLDGWTDPAGNLIQGIQQYKSTFDETMDPYYTFFDITGTKSCYENGTYSCSSGSGGHLFNSTLGWLMGFRTPIQPIFAAGNTPVSVINLYGTKYFILVLDDLNQNHINNGLITITETSKTLPLPSYYNTSLPYVCTDATVPASLLDTNTIGNLSNIDPETAVALGINVTNLFNSLQDKVDIGVGNIPQLVPSAPRTLTQAQLYTINEIIKNRSKTISFRAKAPTTTDTFAILPIKYGGMTTGQLYTEISGQIQDNKRTYFGPVDISRIRIRLLDDRGNVVDLHGGDWCITLISENLYQY